MKFRSTSIAVAVTVGALLLGACGSSTGSSAGSAASSGSSGGTTVRVGLLANLTGAAAPSFGVPFQHGFELAMKDAAPDLQKAGVSIDVATEDAKSEVPSAVTGYNKLKQGGAVVVVQDSQSPLGQAVAPLANDDKIALLSGAGSALENKDGYAFRFTDLSTPTLGMGKYLQDAGAKKIGAVVASDNPSFATLAEVTEKGLSGGYASKQEVSSKDTDFAAVLANLRKDGVDAVVLSVLPAQAGNILLQMQNAGGFEKVRKVGTVAISSEAYTVAGAAAAGFVFPQVWAPDPKSPSAFQDAYSKAYGAAPTAYGALGYQVGWILAAAALQTAAGPGGATGTTLRDALPAASTGDLVKKSGILSLTLGTDGKATSTGVMAEFDQAGTMVAMSGNG
jgi:branched-chain amino acid transport system substrate-binding protein